ncbi:hypothetical protein C8A00DRAFT_44229 [Chaetomidium leptoderma]|uniref:LicD/FKTN/FKRP nucleotidyltransferase domain-containing protein n=1 Tax=Chaetomidium leptoderma TaxID=669021 RepID=A0AAN6VJK4_9PEZI|nr:hypothetical protein C8A00DRAFT_44229 [Chaetomidium leptoderma]
MQPSRTLLLNQRFLLFLTTLLVLSVLLSTAAVARSGGHPFSFYAHQQQQQPQQQQQQTPLSTNPNPNPQLPPQPGPPEYKYFHEAGPTYELTHYDARYFRGPIPYDAHRAVLTDLIRAYLTTFSRDLHLETWLAHGTLLGWWWNGQTLPWDYDIDAQVSGATLSVLADRHNGSLHEYRFENPTTGARETRVYLLDVNPFATAAVGRGEGQNVIDARWVDVGTGMFVDITGLVERDPERRPGVVSCKNHHVYKSGQLFPLRETEFEGVAAMVPWGFDGILVEEYGAKSMVVTEWEGHRWDPNAGEWVKINEAKTEGVL